MFYSRVHLLVPWGCNFVLTLASVLTCVSVSRFFADARLMLQLITYSLLALSFPMVIAHARLKHEHETWNMEHGAETPHPADDQRQRPTTDDRRPTTDDRRPTTKTEPQQSSLLGSISPPTLARHTLDMSQLLDVSTTLKKLFIFNIILAARATPHPYCAATPATLTPPPPALRPVPRALLRGWVYGVSCSRRCAPIPDRFSSTSTLLLGRGAESQTAF